MTGMTGMGTSKERFEEALAGLDLSARYHLAASSVVLPEVHDVLAYDESPDVRSILTHNPATNGAYDTKTMHDPDERARQGLAHSPLLSADAQYFLVEDVSASVRTGLARNCVLELELAHVLARDSSDMVRLALAKNHQVRSDVQDVLSRDDRGDVRLLVASNPEIKRSTALVLASDFSQEVRSAVAGNEGIELGADFPLGCLVLSARGRQVVFSTGTAAGADPEALERLLESWEGTLEELVTVCAELAPDPVASSPS